MKKKLRKIIVEGETFLWRRGHYHLTDYEYSECVEVVTIYLKDYKNSRLELHFRGEDNLALFENVENKSWQIGYPDAGVLWLYISNNDKTPVHINLNRPAVIAQLISYFYKNEWHPNKIKKALL